MKASEIRELTVEDIKAKLEETLMSYEKLKLNHKMSSIENPIELRNMRKTIARLNTELTSKLNEASAK